nr:uncharacterized protein LOC109425891 [Aedes albopictus]
MQAFLSIVLFSSLVHVSLARFRTPTDPVFSDDVTDYDSPSGSDYYDVKEYPVLPGELDAYRKTKPGGLLPSSDTASRKEKAVGTEPSTTSTDKTTRKPRRRTRGRNPSTRTCMEPLPVTTTAQPSLTQQPTTTKSPWRREGGRLIIDGSDPNTDLFKIMRESRRPATKAPMLQRRFPMRDIVGNEIKPESASNRLLVLGSVRGCRETKREDYEHKVASSRIVNPDPKVTGITVEIPPEITRSTYKFDPVSTGGMVLEFNTFNGERGTIKLKWYSCPIRRTGRN